MTITVSNDFDAITIVFDDYIFFGNIQTATMEVFHNCSPNPTNLDIQYLLDASEIARTITMNVQDDHFYDSEPNRSTFKDGVYKFVFHLYEGVLEATHEITYCLFIGSTTNCKAVKAYECTEDEVIEYLHKALQHINDCDNCDCSLMCEIYDALIARINSSTTKTKSDVYNDCGC